MAKFSKAVRDVFVADTPLGTTCPGGMYVGNVPEGTSEPYCSMTLPGGDASLSTEKDYFAEPEVQFDVIGGSLSDVQDAVQDVMDLFDDTQDAITFDEGVAEAWVRLEEPVYIQEEDNPNKWHGIVRYTFSHNKTMA